MNEKVYVVKNYYRHSSYKQITDNWHDEFETPPPSKSSMFSLVKRFETRGSVADAPRSGRPRTSMTAENNDLVTAAFVNSRTKSQSRASIELGISRRSLDLIMDDVGIKPYRPQLVHALNEDDNDRRLQFCERFLAYVEDNPDILDNIIWSDEASFKLNGHVNRHNCVYWSNVNPVSYTHLTLPTIYSV